MMRQLVEIGRDGDDHVADITDQFGAIPPELGEDEGGDFCRRPLLTVDSDGVVGVVHVLFDQVDGAFRITSVPRGGTNQFNVFMIIKINH